MGFYNGVLVAFCVLASAPAFARESSLEDLLRPSIESYERNGRDNNSIETKRISVDLSRPNAASIVLRRLRLQSRQLRRLTNDRAILAAMSKCVFYTKGAYGSHISQEMSRRMASELFQDLTAKMVREPDIFAVSDVSVDVVGSGCGLLLVSKLGNEAVFLTAKGTD